MGTTLTRDAIVASGLRKGRGGFALQDIDLRIPTGSVTGLVGPNGAGKTTLLKSVLGLVQPDAGSVTLFGDERPDHPSVRDRIGVVLDQTTAAPEWRAGTVGRRTGGLYRQWDEALFQQLLSRFGVPGGNRVDALSRGQSVKLSVATALAHHPELLVLDEPTSGLDPVARRDLADVLRQFVIDPAHSVLFSTHITAELDDLADHVVVMNAGRVAWSGVLEDLHDEFAVVRGPAPFPEVARPSTIGLQTGGAGGYQGLVRAADTAWFGPETVIDPATTDDVVVHFAEQMRQEQPR
jgi:ABC-2 type transport system ATP-binding protein